MRVTLSHVTSVHFTGLPEQVRSMLVVMFTGFGSSRINEECHHHLRELEMKGNISRSAKGQRCWSTCIDSELMQQYGRAKLKPCDGGCQQSRREMAKAFPCDAERVCVVKLQLIQHPPQLILQRPLQLLLNHFGWPTLMR
eukprot:1281777-Amphidinium_carterae.2